MIFANTNAALDILDGDDFFVFSTITCIHKELLSLYEDKVHPSDEFDLKYFYNSFVRYLGLHFQHEIKVADLARPKIITNVDGMHESKLSNSYLYKSNILSGYYSFLKNEQDSGEGCFDFSYASRVLCRAINKKSLAEIESCIGSKYNSSELIESWGQRGIYTNL